MLIYKNVTGGLTKVIKSRASFRELLISDTVYRLAAHEQLAIPVHEHSRQMKKKNKSYIYKKTYL